MTIESVRSGKSLDEIESCQNEVGLLYDSLVEVHGQVIFLAKKLIFQDVGLINKYVSKIQELEGELLHIKSLKKVSNFKYSNSIDSYDDGPRSSNVLFPSSNESSDCEDKVIDVTGWYS